MNIQSSLRFAVAPLFAAFVVAALALADFGALAQNTNSSNTGEASAQNANANANTTRRGRGRRGRRDAANTNADAADANANANTGDATATTPAGNANTGAAAAQEEDDDTPRDLSGERVDLSGTYTGRVTTTGGHEMSGEATLTITGNTFTLAGEGMTHNGRIYAVLTRGATSAALYFADIQDTATNTPLVFNVRARKSGERLTLSPAPNTRNRMTFAPAGGRRGRG